MDTNKTWSLELNQKLLGSIEKLAENPQVISFLEKKADLLAGKIKPSLPYNKSPTRKYYASKRKPLVEALKVFKIRSGSLRLKGQKIKTKQVRIALAPRKVEYFYALAGKQKRRGKQIILKYQSPQAVALPFRKAYNKNFSDSFVQEFRQLALKIIEKNE